MGIGGNNNSTESTSDINSELDDQSKAEFNHVDEFGNVIELELHDYVNLQECHDMMNGLHSTNFDPNTSASVSQNHTIVNDSQRAASSFYENGVYCLNCKTGYVYLKITIITKKINELNLELLCYNGFICQKLDKNRHRINFQILSGMRQQNKLWQCMETHILHCFRISHQTCGLTILVGQTCVAQVAIT